MIRVADVRKLITRAPRLVAQIPKITKIPRTKRSALIAAAVLVVVGGGTVLAIAQHDPKTSKGSKQTHKEYVAHRRGGSSKLQEKTTGANGGSGASSTPGSSDTPTRVSMRKTPEQKATDRVARDLQRHRLTQEQADLLVAKIKEIQAYATSIENETQDTWRKLMLAKRPEWREWAEDNKISYRYIDNYVTRL